MMTWQTILYFSSIVLTCGLTGFLAWYAWHQPALPGVRVYAALALSECLLALAEILSMVSGTEAQALFWFKVRFIFNAIIPVLWLMFALEYSGRNGWISKRLLAGMFVIPLITLVMLSGNLQGLWVKHEVTFHQNGIFWIAETSARIPGLWFMVHVFYCLILLLIGIGVILFTAWNKRQHYRGQALMLSGGALIALAIALIPIFNLFPQSEFNPFIPGIGLSAFLYALAIFRFQFLKHSPAQNDPPQMSGLNAQEKRSLAVFIFIFILFTSGIATASYLTYQNYEKQFRAQVESQLSTVTDLKVNGLENWRAERMADAESFHNNPTFTALVQKSLENPDDTRAEEQLQNWLNTVRNSYRYERVFVLDLKGVERISSPATPEPVAAHLTQEAAAIIKTGRVTFLDFHRDSPKGAFHLAVLVPIYAEDEWSHPLGLLVLRIDPKTYLYPYINQWPTPSQSAESLLVRRDGNDVLYLNELKFKENAALNFRTSLEETQVLAVQAVLGKTGIVHGLDYRGMEVMGDVRAVADSPWFVVTHIEAAEVYAPLNERLWQTIFFFGALILAAGTSLILFWRQQRLNYYRAQYETTESLRKSQEQYQGLIEHASDGIFIADSSGKYLEVNPSGCAMLGYSRNEILSLQISDLIAPEDMATTPLRLDELRQGKTILSERRLICKDDSLLPVEISGRMLPDGRFQSIIRDITERKQAEKALQTILRRFQVILSSLYGGILVVGNDSRVEFANQAFCDLFDLDDLPENLLGLHATEIIQRITNVYAHPSAALARIQEIVAAGQPLKDEEISLIGGRTYIRDYIPIVVDGQQYGRLWHHVDITERKRAEDILRESERKLREAQKMAHLGFWLWDVKTGHVEWSEEVFKIFCLDPKGFTPRIDSILDLSPWEEDHQRDQELIDQAIETHTPGSYEQKFLRPDQSIGYYYSTFQGNYDENGELISIVGTVLDITKRKQAEDALKASERKYRQLHESMMDGFVCVGMDGTFLECNEVYRDMLGYSEAELEKITYVNLTPEKWHAFEADIVENQIIKRGYSDIYEKEYRRKDGTIFPVELHTVLTRDENGNPINMWGIARDITERKRAETQLAERHATLNAILESAATPVFSLDRNYRYTSFNSIHAATMKALYDVEIEMGKNMLDYQYLIKDRDEARKNLDRALNGEQIIESAYSGEPGRTRRYFEIAHNPIRDTDGEIIGVSVFVSDITERKQVEESLQEYNTRLASEVEQRTHELREIQEQLVRQERLATLGQLAGSIGHELRNPLGVISNAIYYLKMTQPNASDNIKEYLNIIETETRTSDKIVTDLLDFTRIKSIDRQPASVSELIRQALERCPAPASVEVALDLPTDLPQIYVDPMRVIQVFGNLITNAYQSMDSGVTNGRKLTVSAAIQSAMIKIDIQDMGVGIPPENMKKLFEPLFTTKIKGIGLGLAVSRKLTEANGGRIEVKSEAGKGSTFTVYLPIYKESL